MNPILDCIIDSVKDDKLEDLLLIVDNAEGSEDRYDGDTGRGRVADALYGYFEDHANDYIDLTCGAVFAYAVDSIFPDEWVEMALYYMGRQK